MRKTFIFTILMSCSAVGLIAQSVNYEEVVIEENGTPRSFEQYLTQLAWMNTAENRVLETEKKIAEIEQKEAKWKWVEEVGTNLQFNPSSDNIVSINGREFIQPGVSYGLSINVGGILTNGFERKTAEQKTIIAGHKINQQKLEIRAAVLKAYQKYLLSNEVLKARLQAEEDANAAYNIVSELFKKNRAEVSEYTDASKAYFQALEQRQTAEADIELSILELEEIIGIPWEAAQRFENVY